MNFSPEFSEEEKEQARRNLKKKITEATKSRDDYKDKLKKIENFDKSLSSIKSNIEIISKSYANVKTSSEENYKLFGKPANESLLEEVTTKINSVILSIDFHKTNITTMTKDYKNRIKGYNETIGSLTRKYNNI